MKKTEKRNGAFTLIELLVVISIVSLLASIVLASLNSARDNGRLGAGKYFAAQVHHLAGNESAGVWSFDECSGNPQDSSGLGHHGVFQGAPAYSSDTPTSKGCSLYFDGVDDVVRINSAPTFSTIHGPSTVSLWFKASDLSGSKRIFSDNCFEWGIYHGGTTVGAYAYTGFTGGTVATGKWYQATLVHDHPNGLTGTTLRLYIDGALKGSSTWTFTAENGYNNDVPFWIGADGCTAGTYFNGYIDDVRIYTKALTAAEVGRRYALEAERMLVKE